MAQQSVCGGLSIRGDTDAKIGPPRDRLCVNPALLVGTKGSDLGQPMR